MIEEGGPTWTVDPTRLDASVEAARAWRGEGVRIEVASWGVEDVPPPWIATMGRSMRTCGEGDPRPVHSDRLFAYGTRQRGWKPLFDVTDEHVEVGSSEPPPSAVRHALRVRLAKSEERREWYFLAAGEFERPGALALELDEHGIWILVDGVARIGFLRDDVSSETQLRPTLTSLGGPPGSRVRDLSILRPLTELRELDLSYCANLTDLAPLASLAALAYLDVSKNEQLADLSPLASLTNLVRFNAHGCDRLSDLSPLGALTRLTILDLSGCEQLSELTPLAGLPGLRSLDLNSCDQLIDVSPLASLTGLTSLNLSWCKSLTVLDPVASLHALAALDLQGCESLTDLAPLASLTRLTRLNLGSCARLARLAPLASLTRLTRLNLSSCEHLSDLTALAGLPSLASLDLSDCPELTSDAWWPLETLPALRELEGSFPRWFLARTLASAAARRDDTTFIVEQLDEWLDAARASPTRERILSAVGSAAALLETDEAEAALVELVDLAASHDAPDVEGLFRAASPRMIQPTIAAALARIAMQSDAPLPPETLAALAKHGPPNPALRNATLLALAKGVARESEAPTWAARTARVVRVDLDDPLRHPLDPSVGEHVLTTLRARPVASRLDELGLALFGTLASDHARAAESPSRNPTFETLLEIALAEADPSQRNAALSELGAGVARGLDAAWSRARLDELLRRAAELDPDTSRVRAAIAQAHAHAGRWDDAEDCAFAIAREPIRDACLAELAVLVRASSAADRTARAVSLLGGIEAPALRRERLRDLARDAALLADAATYGELLALLADAPDVLHEVTAEAIAKKPALAGAFVPPAAGPVTARERGIALALQRAHAELLERLRSELPGVGAWLDRHAAGAATPNAL
jgi:hypothetical protein